MSCFLFISKFLLRLLTCFFLSDLLSFFCYLIFIFLSRDAGVIYVSSSVRLEAASLLHLFHTPPRLSAVAEEPLH